MLKSCDSCGKVFEGNDGYYMNGDAEVFCTVECSGYEQEATDWDAEGNEIDWNIFYTEDDDSDASDPEREEGTR